ncbi:UNVERIFIED_CONTAM: hypothetical protein HHA_327700 [Hammondia hammondi]|eukprot:XP_008883699.1 hypothetical protein HHA_327700 [Hammondia hammondi]
MQEARRQREAAQAVDTVARDADRNAYSHEHVQSLREKLLRTIQTNEILRMRGRELAEKNRELRQHLLGDPAALPLPSFPSSSLLLSSLSPSRSDRCRDVSQRLSSPPREGPNASDSCVSSEAFAGESDRRYSCPRETSSPICGGQGGRPVFCQEFSRNGNCCLDAQRGPPCRDFSPQVWRGERGDVGEMRAGEPYGSSRSSKEVGDESMQRRRREGDREEHRGARFPPSASSPRRANQAVDQRHLASPESFSASELRLCSSIPSFEEEDILPRGSEELQGSGGDTRGRLWGKSEPGRGDTSWEATARASGASPAYEEGWFGVEAFEEREEERARQQFSPSCSPRSPTFLPCGGGTFRGAVEVPQPSKATCDRGYAGTLSSLRCAPDETEIDTKRRGGGGKQATCEREPAEGDETKCDIDAEGSKRNWERERVEKRRLFLGLSEEVASVEGGFWAPASNIPSPLPAPAFAATGARAKSVGEGTPEQALLKEGETVDAGGHALPRVLDVEAGSFSNSAPVHVRPRSLALGKRKLHLAHEEESLAVHDQTRRATSEHEDSRDATESEAGVHATPKAFQACGRAAEGNRSSQTSCASLRKARDDENQESRSSLVVAACEESPFFLCREPPASLFEDTGSQKEEAEKLAGKEEDGGVERGGEADRAAEVELQEESPRVRQEAGEKDNRDRNAKLWDRPNELPVHAIVFPVFFQFLTNSRRGVPEVFFLSLFLRLFLAFSHAWNGSSSPPSLLASSLSSARRRLCATVILSQLIEIFLLSLVLQPLFFSTISLCAASLGLGPRLKVEDARRPPAPRPPRVPVPPA